MGRDTRSTLEEIEPLPDVGLPAGLRGARSRDRGAAQEAEGSRRCSRRRSRCITSSIEGVLAIPGQHFIQRYVEKFEILPGFAEGIDERVARRVASRRLRDQVPRRAGAFVEGVPRRGDRAVGPRASVGGRRVRSAEPGPLRTRSASTSRSQEIYAFGFRSFETKLKRLGIDPTEIRCCSEGRTSTPIYEERARRRCGS